MDPLHSFPLVEELVPAPDPEDVFLRMARLPHCLFCDSAVRHPGPVPNHVSSGAQKGTVPFLWRPRCRVVPATKIGTVPHPLLGRYSFLAADPFQFIQCPADGGDALGVLAGQLGPLTTPTIDDLPPFQGGAAGLLSYDLGRSLETLPTPGIDELQLPSLAMGLYDVVVAFDHALGRAWIISQGFPETGAASRRARAVERLKEARGWLTGDPGRAPRRTAAQIAMVRQGALAAQYEVDGAADITSNFSRQGYLQAVQRVIDYIRAGDVFQVNLSQRLLCPAREESPALYRRLRACNPAPFAGYFDAGGFQVLSASPERFLCVRGREVETRPIKGTRPRTGDPRLDRPAEAELLASEKDRAENVMIVDLLRNDLSRVCQPESVRVSQLCGIEAYEHVLHLVSAVRGRLRDECSPLDLLRAAFPGGSVTGAPKIRAMEIIAELEPTARGPYCGAMGYWGFDGSLDLSILIRTITAAGGWWQFCVGGGVVAQSVPEREYEETWHKAEGLLQAVSRP